MVEAEGKKKIGSFVKFSAGILIGAILAPIAAIAYLLSGYAPAAAADPAFPLEGRIAELALQARIKREAPVRDLSQMSSADLLAGAGIYKKECAVCHGLPDKPAPGIASGMFPEAPQLMNPPKRPGQGPGPQRGPSASTAPPQVARAPRPNGDYWRVKNGIRLTGMPSYQKVLTDDEIWQVVGLIANRRRLPPEVKDALATN
jgi:mono/diheme cytochrome c family protein